MFQDHPIGFARDHSVKRRRARGNDTAAVIGVLWHMAETFGVRCEAQPTYFGWKLAKPGEKTPRFQGYLAVEPDGRAFRGEMERAA